MYKHFLRECLMPAAVIAITATIWALARSNEFEVKATKAKRNYGSANPTFVQDQVESESALPTDSESPVIQPIDHRAVSIPMAVNNPD